VELTSTEVLLGWIPCPDAETAERIGRRAVESRLAACANILPGMVSLYRWKGELQRDPEALLLLKTTASRRQDLTDLVVAEHPYELPAVSFLPVTSGHAPFLAWVAAETGAES